MSRIKQSFTNKYQSKNFASIFTILITMRSLILILLFFISTGSFSQNKSIVVVELFTSEGCSSCPPADQLLSGIIDDPKDGLEILGLSFHVDYWDYIGWKDPYASKEYTLRQRVYGRKFRNSSIYTPQIVVNGKHEFVGSDKRKLGQILSLEKGNGFVSNLKLSGLELNGSNLKVTVSSEDIERSILNVAVVERQLSQKVTRGENRGRTLFHDNVVRAYKFRQFDGAANRFELDLPLNLTIHNSSLIVYSQEEKSWHVNGVKKIDLKKLQ